jgi:hypothetical protein
MPRALRLRTDTNRLCKCHKPHLGFALSHHRREARGSTVGQATLTLPIYLALQEYSYD